MRNRSFVFTASAALALSACASAASRNDARPETNRFTSDRISVEVRGQGAQHIILVPGLASHRDLWNGVAEPLDDRYRLHLVQVNGFAGFAPRANADGPVSAPVAEEIARYIRETGLERPAVIGHSMGGAIGMMLAARHADLVGRLMVVDMHPYLGDLFGPPNATPEMLRQTADAFRAQVLADAPGTPTGVLEQMFPGMTRVEAMKPVLLEGVRTTDRRTAANAFHELILTDLRPELARITAPMTVLFVVPPEVPLPPAEFERLVRASYANARRAHIVRIDDSAHFIHLDQPVRFVAEVDALMRR